MNGGDPLEAWAQHQGASIPAPGELVDVGRAAARRARDVSRAPGASSRCRAGEPITVAPTPDFYRWSFASMWTPGPFESKPTRAYYYLTDVDPSWPPERQEEHLRDYNYPTLWSISIHEVYPGHFLHYQHLRRVESKARKSIMFAPASFVEGWAHYCEQMMIEAGFGRQDHGVKLGQLAEALDPPRPLHRLHPAARRRHVGRAGRAVLPRRSVHGGGAARAAKPSAARSIRRISSTASAS